MTERQAELLAFLKDFRRRHGYSPTFQQIARGMGTGSLCNVHRLLGCLERQGKITKVPGAQRSIEIVPEDMDALTFIVLKHAECLIGAAKKTECGDLVIIDGETFDRFAAALKQTRDLGDVAA